MMNGNIRKSVQLQINKLKSLPALPEASVKILQAINDPDISIEKLSEVLALSPGLVARLLGLANSAYFGRTRQIKDLQTAIIQVLGMQLVKSLTVGIVLNVQLDTSECKSFDTGSFWMHSLLTAIGAQKLAIVNGLDKNAVPTIYTSGLLLHIGLLAIVYLFPNDIDEVFEANQSNYLELGREINRHLGLSHYQLGYMLLNKWQLPDVYQMVLCYYEEGDWIEMEAEQIRILHASQEICCLLLEGEIDDQHEALSQVADHSGLCLDSIAKVFNELSEKMENIQELVDVIESV